MGQRVSLFSLARQIYSDGLGSGINGGLVGHVHRKEARLDAFLLQLAGGFFSPPGIACAYQHRDPLQTQLPGDLQSNPFVRAGDQRNLLLAHFTFSYLSHLELYWLLSSKGLSTSLAHW
ncbi:MAG TPA: hypothetical protein VKU00_25995 [Chthonomonadaceae bacterium]|nr:hypothetical protein [Chthonomonadaceae bacterium]